MKRDASSDMTLWRIHGLELHLDMGDADTVERYEKALDQMGEAVPQDASRGTSAYIRAYCQAFRTMYDTLFGAGTSEQIFADIPDNLRKYNAVYGDFLSFVSTQASQAQAEIVQIKKKYLPRGGRS